MRYFTKVVNDYHAPKNQLYVELKELARSLECRVLDSVDDRLFFINNFIRRCEALNKKHSRCKPVSIHQSDRNYTDSSKASMLFIPGAFQMIIYEVKEVQNGK